MLVSARKMSLQIHALCDRHERSTFETNSKALLGMNIAHSPRCGSPSVVARMFCCKSHVTRYSVEFHQVWGLPNPRVDDLPSLLKFFAINRMLHATVLSFTECP